MAGSLAANERVAVDEFTVPVGPAVIVVSGGVPSGGGGVGATSTRSWGRFDDASLVLKSVPSDESPTRLRL